MCSGGLHSYNKVRMTPLQNLLLKSLLDLVVAVAWVRWRRVREWNDEREARAKEQTLRVIHLEPWRWTLTRPPRALWVEPRRVRWRHAHVVAVLVSQPQMAERVRRALRERTTLCYAQTWAELQQIVARVSPSAIIADPAADERGDPARNLLPQIAPVIAEGLADAKLVTISGSGAGAPETTAQNIAAVIQTALAAQLVTRGGLLDGAPTDGRDVGRRENAAKT